MSRLCMPWRYVIMTLGCLANIIAYSDRSNLSLAIVPIQREYGLSEGDVGVALGGFFMGYIFTQVLGGYLAFHLGPKRVLIFAVAFWSAATILTPAAASCGLGMLVAARVAIGLGEGLCLPCLHVLAVEWVPATERSTAAALMTSGQFLGTVCALLAAPLAEWWWPSVFELFGLLGVVWCVLFALLATSTPRQHRHVSAAEVLLIGSQKKTSGGEAAEEGELESREASTQALQPGDSSRSSSGGGGDGSWPSSGSSNDSSTSFQCQAAWAVQAAAARGGGRGASPPPPRHHRAAPSVPWRRLLLSRASCAIYAAHFTHNWGWYLLLSWLPKYLTQCGAGVASAGFLTLLPHLTAFALSNASAALADRVLLRRWRLSLTHTRKLMQAIAQLGPATAFLILAVAAAALPPPPTSPPAPPPAPLPAPGAAGGGEAAGLLALLTALSCVALGLGAFTHTGFWANIMDVAPRHAGLLLGVSNTAATLPGILCNLSTGWILEGLGMPGWTLIFAIACAMELLGVSTYLWLASGEVQV